jgi:hypothetical protein
MKELWSKIGVQTFSTFQRSRLFNSLRCCQMTNPPGLPGTEPVIYHPKFFLNIWIEADQIVHNCQNMTGSICFVGLWLVGLSLFGIKNCAE